jgi:RND family efflux transporter MFP subunit
MNYKHLLLAAITMWIIQSCSNTNGKSEMPKSNSEIIPVKVIEPVLQEVAPVINTSGTFTTDNETLLAFKTGGVIQEIIVKEGDVVKKGQLLATLNLTEIDAQVAQAKLGFEKSKRDYQRVQNLYRDSVATLEQFQNSKTALEVAEKQYEAAQFNKSYSEIRAVANGVVLRKMANEGQVVGPGTPILQTNSSSQNNWKLRAGLSDREWAIVAVGDKATITTDAIPNKSFTGKVSSKSGGTDMISGALSVEISIENLDTRLASGLYGQAEIITSAKQKFWRIPYEALLDGNAQNGYVFFVGADKKAHKAPVIIERIERNEVIIRSGLEDVTQLIISGSAYLREGSTVNIQ